MKKWITILMAGCLLINLYACSPAGEKPVDPAEDPSLPSSGATTPELPVGASPAMAELSYFPEEPEGENILKWVIQDDAGLNMRDDIVNAVNQILKERGRNYQLQVVTVQSNQADMAEILEEKLNGDFDLLRVAAVEKNYLPFDTMGALAEKELLLPLNSYLQTPEGQKIMDQIAWEKDWLQGMEGDTVYGIPVNSAYLGVRNIIVSDQVIEEFGCKPEDFQQDFWEQPEVLEKIYQKNEQQPFLAFSFGAQTAKGITIPAWLPTDPRYSMITSLAAVDRYDEEKKIVNIYETEYFEQCLAAMAAFYEKGYLLSQQGMQEPDRQLISYQTGTMLTNTHDVQKGNYIYSLGQPAVFNQFLQPRLANAVSAHSKKQEEALDFLTLLHTDEELCQLVAYGIPEQDYTASEGIIESRGYQAGVYNGAYLVYGEEFTSLTTSSALLTFPEKEGMSRKEAYRSYLDEAALDPYASYAFDMTPVQAEFEAAEALIHEYALQVASQIQEGKSKAGLEELRRKLKEAGADRIIAELQKQAEKFIQESE